VAYDLYAAGGHEKRNAEISHYQRPVSALALFVARVLAYDANHAPATNDLAVLADGLDGTSHFHRPLPSFFPACAGML